AAREPSSPATRAGRPNIVRCPTLSAWGNRAVPVPLATYRAQTWKPTSATSAAQPSTRARASRHAGAARPAAPPSVGTAPRRGFHRRGDRLGHVRVEHAGDDVGGVALLVGHD